MNKLRFFRDSLRERYGASLQRIALDPGFSCPNRLCGAGPCSFCAEDGARARHLQGEMSPQEQVARGVRYVRERYGASEPYIAYFQAFTGTNAPAGILRKVYREFLALANFKMVIIGTRPDCLPDDVIDVLAELQKDYDILVELGVQTACDRTLARIRRGHDFACTADAVRRLNARGIPAAAHLILGLPGETKADWLATADAVAALPFCAVKIHPLLILKGAPLASEYTQSPFPTLNEYEYADALCDVVKRLPEGMTLMRLTAEAEPDDIIAPKWWMKKGQFMEMFTHKFEHRENVFTPCRTEDGSYTLYHPAYRQHFHSLAGAQTESLKKYIEPAKIADLLKQRKSVRVLDIGFGLGCNARAAIHTANETAAGHLEIISLENDPGVLDAALSLPECEQKMFHELKENGTCRTDFASLDILFGDARKSVQQLVADNEKFDAVFLDGFSPDVNPELWTADFLAALKSLMTEQAILVTYSSAYPLFGAIIESGMTVYRTPAFGRRRSGTAAAMIPCPHLEPLSEKDSGITLKSTAGTPYRDPDLNTERDSIFARRKEEVTALRAQGIPKWFKN